MMADRMTHDDNAESRHQARPHPDNGQITQIMEHSRGQLDRMITSLPHTRSLLRRQSIFLCPKYLVNLSSVPSVWWLSLSLSQFVARPCSPTHFSLLVSVWLWPLTTLCSHNTIEERNKTTNYLNFSPLSCYLGGLIVGCWKSKTVKLAVDSDKPKRPQFGNHDFWLGNFVNGFRMT